MTLAVHAGSRRRQSSTGVMMILGVFCCSVRMIMKFFQMTLVAQMVPEALVETSSDVEAQYATVVEVRAVCKSAELTRVAPATKFPCRKLRRLLHPRIFALFASRCSIIGITSFELVLYMHARRGDSLHLMMGRPGAARAQPHHKAR